jgi:hypothetical protein
MLLSGATVLQVLGLNIQDRLMLVQCPLVSGVPLTWPT